MAHTVGWFVLRCNHSRTATLCAARRRASKQMKMRNVRKATLVGGIATGALLFAGTAAQAAETEVEEAGLDAVQSAPELLGGLPVPTDAVPGLDAVQHLPVPGLGNQPTEYQVTDADKAGGQADGDQSSGNAVTDLLGNLGGGLPVPLPF